MFLRATLLAMCLLFAACSVIFPVKTSTEERIRGFSAKNTALREPVEVRWNAYLVPFVTANNNHDLAYTLGMLHGHLRASQVQLLKRVAYARLSELGGPYTNEVDHLLKLLDFPRAAEAVYRNMPEATRNWVDAFAAGFNHQMLTGQRPPDFGIFNLEAEPLTPQNIIAIGRVAGADINWGRYAGLLRERLEHPNDWPQRFADALELGYGNVVQRLSFLDQTSRSGSNSIALSPHKSAGGGALLLSDPHLGFFLPNAWLLVGVKSPDLHAVGGMAPGLPFIAFGRNPHLAWGGTNMRSASSDLYRITEADLLPATNVKLHNRFWFNKTLTLRQSRLGPVVSDHPWFAGREGELIALRWKGHEVSDEISAFLALNRTTSVRRVAQAMRTFGVSGQHIVTADSSGNIGHIPAVHLPRRPFERPSKLVLDPKRDAWQGYDDAATLDRQINPPRGYVISANDHPPFVRRSLGYFFGVPDRIRRLEQLLDQPEKIDLQQAIEVQTDSLSPYAAELAAKLTRLLGAQPFDRANADFIRSLDGWNGDYKASSRQPVVFETLLYHLLHDIYRDRLNEDGELPSPYSRYAWQVERFPAELAAKLAGRGADASSGLAASINQTVDKARKDAADYPTWGDMHYMRLGPVYINLPYIGGWFRGYRFPVSGSRQTLMKTNHDLVRESHRATYGSQSRHISDMSNPDANYFALLGGQDGWPGSEHYADQIELWRTREYIQLPLTREKVVADFPWVSEIGPD